VAGSNKTMLANKNNTCDSFYVGLQLTVGIHLTIQW